ncbi:MAG: tRNA (adenosine(37)-N6)-threonylcarbamoyltransferase complex dimerization subunit type 1 TsaB [Candidatus Dormibacteria bacterium]
MSVLAIDTASRGRVVVVVADRRGGMLSGGCRNGAAVELLAIAMREAAASDVDAVVCVVGPGSFTGLRAGLAAAVGVAQATGVPLHGVCSLDVVVAAAALETPGMASLDAGRGGRYLREYARSGHEWAPISPLRRLAGDQAPPIPCARLEDVAGHAHAAGLAAIVPGALTSPALDLAGIVANYVD